MATPIGYITARFPPMQSSGTYRVESVLRYLPDHQFVIRPVTMPDGWIAQETGDPEVVVDYPGVLQPTAPSDRVIRVAASVPGIRWLLRAALVPDILSRWAHSVAEEVAAGLGDVELVYATSPPFSAMILADRVGALLGVPVVQELRDPPSFNRRLRGRSKLWKRRMQRFEGRYLTGAASVIEVTEGTRERLLATHPGFDPDRHFVVTNGYPEMDPDLGLSGRDPDRFTIAYVGSFQGSTSNRRGSVFTPAVLLPALAKTAPGTSELRVVGQATNEQQRSIASTPGGDRVTFVGQVPRSHAIAEVAAADLVLVLAEDDDWWIGRKVFEALAYASRILAVVPDSGDTAKLLAPHGKATVVAPDRIDTLPDVVDRMIEADRDSAEASTRPVIPSPGIQTDASSVRQIAEVLRATLDRSSAES